MARTFIACISVALGCGHAVAPSPPPHPNPRPRPRLAVLGLTADDPVDAPRAAALTRELRTLIATPYALATSAGADRSLAELTQLATCPSESAACMAAIGADLRVDYLVYGHLDRDHTHLHLALLDVAAHVNRRVATAATARAAYGPLVDR